MPPLPVTVTRLAALLAAVAAPSLAAAATSPADLELHGTRLSAACRGETWPQALADIEQAAAGRAGVQLAALLRAYLCDDDTAAQALVRRHAPPHVLQLSEGTGEAPVWRRVDAAQALAPRGGRVWGLQVRRAAPARITLHWQADEACVQGADLVHRAGSWRFAQTASACD